MAEARASGFPCTAQNVAWTEQNDTRWTRKNYTPNDRWANASALARSYPFKFSRVTSHAEPRRRRRGCGSVSAPLRLCVRLQLTRPKAIAKHPGEVDELLGGEGLGALPQVHGGGTAGRRHLTDGEVVGVAQDALELLSALLESGARELAQRPLVVGRQPRRVVGDDPHHARHHVGDGAEGVAAH